VIQFSLALLGINYSSIAEGVLCDFLFLASIRLFPAGMQHTPVVLLSIDLMLYVTLWLSTYWFNRTLLLL
jgi:hypothetical protein